MPEVEHIPHVPAGLSLEDVIAMPTHLRPIDPAAPERVRPPSERERELAAGYVYAIGMAGTDLVKIGYSATSPEGRLAGLQTANPFQLELLAVWPGSVETERAMHKFLVGCGRHQRGEWFRLAPDLIRSLDGRAAIEVANALGQTWLAMAGGAEAVAADMRDQLLGAAR